MIKKVKKDRQENGASFSQICQILDVDPQLPGWPDRFGKSLSNYLSTNKQDKIRTLSLFSGAGGLDIGFHDLGFDIIESVEIEKKFSATLVLNSGKDKMFESSKVNCIDIREYSGDNLGKIDFIIGGPPCQTFSAAGRRASGVLGTTDARGVLFREYVRLLHKLQPKGFLFENVYGITGAQNGEAWKEIQKSFCEEGYQLFFRIIDAADFGVPQHRERLIIVGLKDGEFCFPRPTHGPDSIDQQPFYNAGTAVTGLNLTEDERRIGITGKFGQLMYGIPPGLNYSFYTAKMGHPHPIFAWRSKFSDFMYKADPEMPVRTIKAQGGQYTGPLHWDTRYFSYGEFKRLQTFPDDYVISGNKQVAVHQIGNSVPPQLARMMALAIRMQVFKTEFPFKLTLLDQEEELSFRQRKTALTRHYAEKARIAIEALLAQEAEAAGDDHPNMDLINCNFFLTLTDRFGYSTNNEQGDFSVSVTWTNEMNVSVTPCKKKTKNPLTITVSPKYPWTLPVARIKMAVFSNDWFAVTAAWKVVDKMLSTNNLKADLVQLNGYYQYESQIECSFEGGRLPNRTVMKTIYEGEVVGKNLTTEELAQKWKITADQVIEKAVMLRTVGYEIRNSHTNPQIPEGIWLIPYKFPTLLPQSIQLNKTLR